MKWKAIWWNFLRLEVQLLSDHLPPLQVCFRLIIDSLPKTNLSDNRLSSISDNRYPSISVNRSSSIWLRWEFWIKNVQTNNSYLWCSIQWTLLHCIKVNHLANFIHWIKLFHLVNFTHDFKQVWEPGFYTIYIVSYYFIIRLNEYFIEKGNHWEW